MTDRLRLDVLPEVLTGEEVAAVLGLSRRQFYRLRRHGLFPIPELPRLGHPRFAKAAVARYLDQTAVTLSPARRARTA